MCSTTSKQAVSQWSKGILAVTFSVIVLSGTGCATMIKGGYQSVTFESDPPGAIVSANGTILGKTPITTSTVKGIPVVDFQLEGYQQQFVNPARESMWRVEPWFWGNLLWIFTGPGAIVGIPASMLVDIHEENAILLESPICVRLYPNPVAAAVPTSQVTPPPKPDTSDNSKPLQNPTDYKEQNINNFVFQATQEMQKGGKGKQP